MDVIQELTERLEKIGHQFLGVVRSDGGLYYVYVLDPKEATKLYGPRPMRETSRDFTDFRESLKHWKIKGTYVLHADRNPETALANALFKVPK